MSDRPICRGCGHERAHHENDEGRCTYGHGTTTGGCDCPQFGRRRRKRSLSFVAPPPEMSPDFEFIATRLQAASNALADVAAAFMPSLRAAPPSPIPKAVKPRELRLVRDAAANKSGDLTKGQIAILQRVVQHGALTRGELTTLTGYKRSTRNRLISELHALGCVETNGQVVSWTDEGRRRNGPVEQLPVGDALRRWWLDRLNEGQSVMLEALALVYPNGMTGEELDRATGYAKSTRNRLIQELHAAKLVTKTGGRVRASDKLFDRPQAG